MKFIRHVSTRLAPEQHKAFVKLASRNGGTSQFIRRLVEAAIENRLTIHPKKTEEIK